MRFHSTRSKSEQCSFEEAILSAYAPDGGLYVPETVPSLPEDYRTAWSTHSFPNVCAEIFHIYSGIDLTILQRLCEESYKDFNDSVNHLPLQKFGDVYLLDTSLGPTLAFKDIGQQIMGKLINYLLAQRGTKGNIVVETSGDTGPAAIAGVKGSSNINIFCLYPSGRVSEVQELQMITVSEENVHVYRTEGNTDEQASVLKEIFEDRDFLKQYNIFSVNSINIGRIIAQSSYFVWASLQEGICGSITVVIPTGAFGNAMGAYLARLMGAPIDRIVCATNANDIVHRTISKGDLRMDVNRQTVSPAMDIQFAYNLERMLYFVSGCDASFIAEIMQSVEQQYRLLSASETAEHRVQLPPTISSAVQQIFFSYSCSDEETLDTIRRFHTEHAFVLCPHSATAVHVVQNTMPPKKGDATDETIIAVLTAHPDKFEDTVERALGFRVPASEKVQRMKSLPHRFQWLRKGADGDGSGESSSWRQQWIETLRRDIVAANK